MTAWSILPQAHETLRDRFDMTVIFVGPSTAGFIIFLRVRFNPSSAALLLKIAPITTITTLSKCFQALREANCTSKLKDAYSNLTEAWTFTNQSFEVREYMRLPLPKICFLRSLRTSLPALSCLCASECFQLFRKSSSNVDNNRT